MSQVYDFDELVIRRGTDAKKYLGVPEDVIPLWIADMDFRCPQPVIDVCVSRMQDGVYGYPGISEEFKKAVSFWMASRFQLEIPASNVEYVPGVIPGIICAIRAFSNPGDYVAMLTPTYPPFKDAIEHNGRFELRSPLKVQDGRYEIDFDDLEEKLSRERCRIFLLCNPHNPCGRVFSKTEQVRIGELCLKHHVIVISDEIHQDLVYSEHRHIPFAGISEECAAISITFISSSKAFNTAGFRTAAMYTFNPVLKNRVHEEIINNKGIGENLCGTAATIAAYTKCGDYVDQLISYVERNLCLAEAWLKENPEIQMIRPEGTYLLWLDCRKLQLTQEKLVSFFLEEAKVYLNDGITFGPEGEGYMRLNIAASRTVLEEALNRIGYALKNLRS